jgi:hypothetical protein
MQRYSYVFLSSAVSRGARQAVRPFSTNPTIKASGFDKKSDIPSYQRDDKAQFNASGTSSGTYRQPSDQSGKTSQSQYQKESDASQHNRTKDSDTPNMTKTSNTYTTGKSSDARTGSSMGSPTIGGTSMGSSKSTAMDSKGQTGSSEKSNAQWNRDNNPSNNPNINTDLKNPEYEGRLYGEDRTTADQVRDRNGNPNPQRRFMQTKAEQPTDKGNWQQMQKDNLNQRTEASNSKWEPYKAKDKADELKENAAKMRDSNNKSWDVNEKWESYKDKDKADELKEKAAKMRDSHKKSWDVNDKL